MTREEMERRVARAIEHLRDGVTVSHRDLNRSSNAIWGDFGAIESCVKLALEALTHEHVEMGYVNAAPVTDAEVRAARAVKVADNDHIRREVEA